MLKKILIATASMRSKIVSWDRLAIAEGPVQTFKSEINDTHVGINFRLELFCNPINLACLALHVAGRRTIFADKPHLFVAFFHVAPVGKVNVCGVGRMLDFDLYFVGVHAQTVGIAWVLIGVEGPHYTCVSV